MPTAQEEQERAAADAVVADVEVYENQVWGADGEEGGQHVLHRWSYSDGTPATPPSEVQLPDMWLWEGDWSVDCDHTPTCDEAGWHDLDDDSSTVTELTKGENIKSVYTRRRRWVRTMRLRSGASTDSSLRGIKALKEHPRGRAAATAAATALHHAAAANTSTDTTVQATGDAARAGVARPAQPADAEEGRRKRRASGIATLAVPANVTANVTAAAAAQATGDAAAAEQRRLARQRRPLGSALSQWWEREFVFRGFGVGLVKPLFAGYMLRGNLSDMGVGLRMPITSHFNCWEARRDLPLISSSLFFFWPLKVQTSFTMSVASAQLQDWAGGVKGLWLALADSFTAEGRQRAKIWLSGSGEGGAFAKKPVQRRTTVTRVGVTVSVRLSAEYGLQVWASPYIFLLPGVRIITDALSSALALILGTRDTAAAVEARRLVDDLIIRWAQEAARLASATYAVALWASLCKWAGRKTSGLGYSLSYSRERLCGSVLVNFQPFFLPPLRLPRARSAAAAAAAAAKGVPAAVAAAKASEDARGRYQLQMDGSGAVPPEAAAAVAAAAESSVGGGGSVSGGGGGGSSGSSSGSSSGGSNSGASSGGGSGTVSAAAAAAPQGAGQGAGGLMMVGHGH